MESEADLLGGWDVVRVLYAYDDPPDVHEGIAQKRNIELVKEVGWI